MMFVPPWKSQHMVVGTDIRNLLKPCQVLQAVLEKYNIPAESFAAVCVIVDKVLLVSWIKYHRYIFLYG